MDLKDIPDEQVRRKQHSTPSAAVCVYCWCIDRCSTQSGSVISAVLINKHPAGVLSFSEAVYYSPGLKMESCRSKPNATSSDISRDTWSYTLRRDREERPVSKASTLTGSILQHHCWPPAGQFCWFTDVHTNDKSRTISPECLVIRCQHSP